RRNYDQAGQPFSLLRMLRALRDSVWGLLAPVVIVGGIYWGIFTPTEAAGVAVIYGLLVGLFIYRELNLGSLVTLIRNTAVDTSVVMLIIACSSLFAWVVSIDGAVVAWVRELGALMNSQWQVFLVAGIVLLIAGLFIDGASIYLVIIPLLMPAVNAHHIDLVWFGVFAAIAIGIGQFTPPVGVNIFVAARVLGVRFHEVVKELLPFLLISFAGLLIIYFFPAASTWLVSTMR